MSDFFDFRGFGVGVSELGKLREICDFRMDVSEGDSFCGINYIFVAFGCYDSSIEMLLVDPILEYIFDCT